MNTQKLLLKISLIIFLFCNAIIIKAQSVAINIDGTTAANSALLDVKSTTQGILIPRMTAAQRTAIATPATGLMVYQTDATAGFYFYNGTAWTSLNGTNGTNGQGVPTGGTANQVLAKVNGTDYNTAWITPSSGSTEPSLQLFVVKTTPQTTQNATTATPDAITFSTTNGTGANLTNGNTFNGSTFTVGSTGAGLYSFEVRLTGTSQPTIPMLDINGTGYSATSIYGNHNGYPSGTGGYSPSGYGIRGFLITTLYLAAGNTVTVRGASTQTNFGGDMNGNATCRFVVVKLN
jgi:hypothetical protein